MYMYVHAYYLLVDVGNKVPFFVLGAIRGCGPSTSRNLGQSWFNHSSDPGGFISYASVLVIFLDVTLNEWALEGGTSCLLQ